MTEPEISLSGDDTAVVSGPSVPELRTLSRSLRRSGDWLEVVDGIQDVSIQFDPLEWTPEKALEALKSAVRVDMADNEKTTDRLVELEVRFGGNSGPDMQLVCDKTGLSEDDIVECLLHSELLVDMMGFVPGFAYIGGVPEVLNIPRLETPRKSVPAGSLGLAAGKCGTYALEGPGGWPLIGRITTPLFSPKSEKPFLLEAGCRVKLVRETSR